MARATELIEGADIMVFSKVSCGFSTRAKQAIVSNVEGAKEKMEVLELDMEPVSQPGSEGGVHGGGGGRPRTRACGGGKSRPAVVERAAWLRACATARSRRPCLRPSPHQDGKFIQKALADITGQRTVPNVFVKGEHVGGCDDTLDMLSTGAFQRMLDA